MRFTTAFSTILFALIHSPFATARYANYTTLTLSSASTVHPYPLPSNTSQPAYYPTTSSVPCETIPTHSLPPPVIIYPVPVNTSTAIPETTQRPYFPSEYRSSALSTIIATTYTEENCTSTATLSSSSTMPTASTVENCTSTTPLSSSSTMPTPSTAENCTSTYPPSTSAATSTATLVPNDPYAPKDPYAPSHSWNTSTAQSSSTAMLSSLPVVTIIPEAPYTSSDSCNTTVMHSAPTTMSTVTLTGTWSSAKPSDTPHAYVPSSNWYAV